MTLAEHECWSGSETSERSQMDGWVITLDGPAASGKSSAARQVAERLGIPFVSSGLLYRAATYLILEHGTLADDELAILELLTRRQVKLEPKRSGSNCVLVEGRDITGRLHNDSVDNHVSAVARHPRVRAWVYHRLREIRRPFVVEGRDMGTVVFPHAPFKFYLTASAEVRAKRRAGERSGGLEQVTEALKRRDLLDAKQLRPAPDAVHIDTSDMTLEDVVTHVLRDIQQLAQSVKACED